MLADQVAIVPLSLSLFLSGLKLYCGRVLGFSQHWNGNLHGGGFSTGTVPESIEVIERIAHSGRSFISDRHTKENLRKEHRIPNFSDRGRYEIFEQSNQRGIIDSSPSRTISSMHLYATSNIYGLSRDVCHLF